MAKNNLVFSGIQPTGTLHLGNYLGAIKNWVKLQQDMPCLFCLVDLHAITIWQEPKELKKSTYALAAALMAAGIDVKKNILFHQSGNPDHANLAWIFNCVARLGWLNRMTQFKDKAGKDRERASTGLFIYPNLMAADILLYHATQVPVGEDQKQHLELARDIAIKFNNDFSAPDFFPTPEPLILKTAARVMSLKDGTKKMSKSDLAENSRINLTDDDDMIHDKIKKARTDSGVMPDRWDETLWDNRPEIANLLDMTAGLLDKKPDDIIAEWAGKEFAPFKKYLAEILINQLAPIRKEMLALMKDENHLTKTLHDGAMRAREKSAPIMEKIRALVGFV